MEVNLLDSLTSYSWNKYVACTGAVVCPTSHSYAVAAQVSVDLLTTVKVNGQQRIYTSFCLPTQGIVMSLNAVDGSVLKR